MTAARKPALGRLSSDLIRGRPEGPSGTPEDIARAKRSYTGAFLKPVLERRENKRKVKIEAAE